MFIVSSTYYVRFSEAIRVADHESAPPGMKTDQSRGTDYVWRLTDYSDVS